MSPDRQRRIRELFDSACELPASERMAWLSEQRQDTPEIIEAARKLVQAANRSGDFLSKPAVQRHETIARQGKRIGPYKVIRELGMGGMGVVYLCVRDDDVFERTVALKIIRAEKNTPQLVARFHTERQTLAALDHTNIARIVDGGTTEDGLPYLVMDYIEGDPIDVFCNKRKATLTQRINLIRQVCRAVEYLHSNRILHRDLKPSNILVTQDGLVKLLDFGIAKQMGENRQAAATTLALMTPEYASPEQILMKPLGPASDTYSVGAVLYLLLTGHPPFALSGKPLKEVIEIVSEHTPLDLSKVLVSGRVADESFAVPVPLTEWRSSLKGDLDRIAARALRTEAERRYPETAALADDLRRFQQNQPVLARGNTRVYTAIKFFRRNRVFAMAGLIVLLSLSAAGVAMEKYYDAYDQLRTIQKIARSQQTARNLFAQIETQNLAAQSGYVRDQVQQIRADYTDRIGPMLSNPLAPRHAIARTAEDSVTYLTEMAPAADRDPETALSAAEAYLAISKLQWSSGGASLHDAQAANATAAAALKQLHPLAASSARLASMEMLRRLQRQLRDTAANTSKS